MRIVSSAFNYVIRTSVKYGIDESHSLGHSMLVYNYANEIYNATVLACPQLKHQLDVVQCASILHDTCDKKYLDENQGDVEMRAYLGQYLPPHKIDAVSAIVRSMSYSTVKSRGYPDLGIHTSAYHVVREADLLAAYDYNRCVIFGMLKENLSFPEAQERADVLMETRVLTYIRDGLFVNEYSQRKASVLHYKLLEHMERHRGKYLYKTIQL